ncbi:MAG TPA: rhomboid family intramembrane serine protease [Caulobacteraceae bacterium]
MSHNGPETTEDRPGREPAVTAPWPPLVLGVALIGLFVLQGRAPDQELLYLRYGLSPEAAEQGRRLGFVTSLFVHGNWAHVLMNAIGALAFGAGVARLFGTRILGAAAFFLFFLVCGALAGAAFVWLKAGAPVVLIGASGGVSGLMGAASRVIGRERGLAPFTSPSVIGLAVGWLVVNLLVAVLGFAPGAGTTPVAWEAHLAGYAAGLLLVGPVTALLGRRDAPAFDSRA